MVPTYIQVEKALLNGVLVDRYTAVNYFKTQCKIFLIYTIVG